MAEMTQDEAKYLIFDAMLAAQELSWASRLPSLVVEMIELDRELTEFYFSLDSFQNLVYTSYVNKNGQSAVIESFHKDILPRLKRIQDQLKTHEKKFRNYSIAQRQLNEIWKFNK